MANNVIEILIQATDKTGNVVTGIAGKLGSTLGGALKVGALGAGAALGGLTGFLTLAAKEAIDAEQGQAELAAVLKSTKGAAGMTADAVNDLATKWSEVTMFSDDAVLSGENLLLTFTNIGKNVFPQATEATLNLAQKFGSMESAATQIGKALNDPTQGLTALTRVGVTFTEQQKEQIKALQEAGDIEGAQKIILRELQTEYGGLAEAAGGTLAGKMTILRNKFLNVAEGIGGKLIPVLSKGLDYAIKFGDWAAPKIEAFAEAVDPVIEAFSYVVYWLGEAFTAGQEAGGIFGGIGEALNAMFYVFQDGQTTFFSKILESFGMSTEKAQEWGLRIVNTAQSIGSAVRDVADFLASVWTIVSPGLTAVGNWFISFAIPNGIVPAIQAIWGAISDLWTQAKPYLEQFALWFAYEALPAIIAYIKDPVIPTLRSIGAGIEEVWNFAKPYLEEFGAWFIDEALPAIVAFVRDDVVPTLGSIGAGIADFWDQAKPYLEEFGRWFIEDALPAIVAFIKDPVIPTVRSIADGLVNMWNTVSPYLARFAEWFTTTALPNIVSFIRDTVLPNIRTLRDTLMNLWTNIQPGLNTMYNWFKDSLGWVKVNVIDPLVNALSTLKNTWNDVKNSGVVKWAGGALNTLGFAEGGYTGGGPSSQVAGVVHRNEWVVPERGALVLRGDGGGAQNITVNVTDSVMATHPNATTYGQELAASIQSRLRFAGGGVVAG